jgi:SnoaL-like domain
MSGIVEPDLATLQAVAALSRLVTTYSRAVDRRDFALLRSLYADDAEERHGHAFEGGVDGYIAFVRKALSAYEATAHYVVQTSFVVDGDCAEGEVHKINYHRTPAPEAQEIVTGSRSLDHYVRRDGRWLFQARAVMLDWARRAPVDPAAYDDPAAQSPMGKAGGDDLSYRLLHAFGLHPATTKES